MRVRTFLGIVVALVFVVAVSYLTNQNIELLSRRFMVGAERSVPVYVAMLAAFLVGFLPAVSVLLVQTLRRDLAARRERRLDREARSRRDSFRRAVDLQVDGQWGRATAEFEALLAEQGEDFATLLRYGEVLRRQGRLDEAIEIHRRASVLYPHSVAMLAQLAEDYESRVEPEVARQIRDRVLRDFPGVALQELRRRRNEALGAREWKEAAHLQQRIEALQAESGEESGWARDKGIRLGLDYQRAVALVEGESLDEAKGLLEEVLRREPLFVPARIMLGEAALLSGHEEEALDQWRRGFEETGSPVFLQRIEDHFIEGEQPREALENLHALIAAAGNDLLPRFFLGRLYYRLEMHGEALRVLSGLRERVATSPSFHHLLGRIHQRRGEVAKAVECYLACIEEAGVAATEYQCRVCLTKYDAWSDRCDLCGSWNAVELDFREEQLTPEELGLKQAPVWPVVDDLEGS